MEQHLRHATDFESWRRIARLLLRDHVSPVDVVWLERPATQTLFSRGNDLPSAFDEHVRQRTEKSAGPGFHVPPRFLESARYVACHRDPARWETLYRVLWRLVHGESALLDIPTDDDVRRLELFRKAVNRDAHKAKAFVRFRKVQSEDVEHYVAWHRPDHCILRLIGPFFARRFPSMHWTILTPDESVAWNLNELKYGPGATASAAPDADELECLWKTYYASIFNPARIKLKMMKREMPVRHWPTLPETRIIDELLEQAPERVNEMIRRQEGFTRSARDYFPTTITLESLAQAAAVCEACDLCRPATQTIFGEGPADASLMLVGEQPGDAEDHAGRPFVGPAGQLLDDALARAALPRSALYVTNAVKHFKFTIAGKRRLHKKPHARELAACRPWLDAEVEALQPDVIVALGVTAAHAVIGRDFRLTEQRGQIVATSKCSRTLASWHPAAILRNPSADRRSEMLDQLVADLRLAGSLTDE